MRFLKWLGQRWCRFRYGHSTMAFIDRPGGSWKLKCYRCGWESAGWVIEHRVPTSYSNRDFQQIEQDLTDIELDLHGGG